MFKSKFVGIVALMAFAMGIVLVGDALAGESGKVVNREVWYFPTIQTLKVPDVEGHTIHLLEGKGIAFTEKWGAITINEYVMLDLIKGEWTCQSYVQSTFPDGSTTTHKGVGKGGASGGEGTWTYIKGTGKFEGIQGGGTWKAYGVAPDRNYDNLEGEYTLP